MLRVTTDDRTHSNVVSLIGPCVCEMLKCIQGKLLQFKQVLAITAYDPKETKECEVKWFNPLSRDALGDLVYDMEKNPPNIPTAVIIETNLLIKKDDENFYKLLCGHEFTQFTTIFLVERNYGQEPLVSEKFRKFLDYVYLFEEHRDSALEHLYKTFADFHSKEGFMWMMGYKVNFCEKYLLLNLNLQDMTKISFDE